MKIQEERLAEIVKNNPQLLNFLDRLDIPLGFGDKTIEEVCRKYQIQVPFFVELMQLLIKKYEFNPLYIDEFEPKLTIKYLRNSHNSYLKDYLPDIDSIIKKLKATEPNRANDCNILMNYFRDYRTECVKHLQREDNIIFPYILQLENAVSEGNCSDELMDQINKYPIRNYVREHDSLNEMLNDLKFLIIKYFKPFDDAKAVRSLVKILYDLDEDLHLHELIENHILFPQAQKMEEQILKMQLQHSL